jgi:hypothetical protein
MLAGPAAFTSSFVSLLIPRSDCYYESENIHAMFSIVSIFSTVESDGRT